MLNEFDLSNKNAFITGGNSGIGLGIARGLARGGAKIAICGRSREKNSAALQILNEIIPGCQAFQFDLENVEKIPEFYEKVSKKISGVDILVNNAGIQHRGRAEEIELPDLNRVLTVNLVAPFVLAQSFARERIERQHPGAILFIASLMSEAARPTVAPYTASKGGIRQLIKALAVEWAPHDIRVNGIGPGYISTGMNKALLDDSDFDAWVKKRTPLGRWGNPQDFEAAALFLTSPASRFITGQILYVDGGWLATF